MFLGILTLLVALSISAISAYYSILGLTAIFAAAWLPIVLMGSVLEVGKILSTVWLHTNWKRAPLLVRSYLIIAVAVLMFITSMGVFGFLSKSHIEQTSASTEGTAQLERIETEIARYDALIVRAEQKITKAESSTNTSNTTIQEQIDTEQQRIDATYSRIQPAIDEQNAIIQNARADDAGRTKPYEEQLTNIQAEVLRLEASAKEYEQKIVTLEADTSPVQPLLDGIKGIEDEIIRVTNQLQSKEGDQVRAGQAIIGVSSDGAFGGNTRRALVAWVEAQRTRIAQTQLDISRLRQDATSQVDAERERLASVIADTRTIQIPALKEREIIMLAKIDEVRATESPAIATARDEISRIRSSADSQIEASQSLIQKLRDSIQVGTDLQVDDIVLEQTDKIKQANLSIDTLTEQKYTIQATSRKLEAEVGPIKYIAELVYGANADTNMLESAVRWVIILIVVVFDPLAVFLVLAGAMTISWAHADRKAALAPKTPIITDDPKIKELEMELRKHNEILDELEKLLDSNLGKVDPIEYAKLKKEQDTLVEQQAALIQSLEEARAESETLVDKVVSTEAERDEYRVQLENISEGASAFQKRIEDLLSKIVGLEDEIVRRDAVVLKMAEKYQLVEKDSFGDDLIAAIKTEK